MNTSACCWLRLTGLSAFVLFSTFEASKADELKYWVSEHFSEAPNVKYNPGEVALKGSRIVLPEAEIYAPSVLDLSDLDWSYDQDAPVRLCFDNRPLQESYDGATSLNSKWNSFCKHYNYSLHGNYKSYREDDRANRGVLIYRNEIGGITCEAVFTTRSLISLISNYYPEKKQLRNEGVEITPYRWAEDPTHIHRVLQNVITEPDFVDIEFGFGGLPEIKRIDIENTWSCLLPSYRVYWQKALSACLSGADILSSTSDKDSIFSPILEDNFTEIRSLVAPCLVGREN